MAIMRSIPGFVVVSPADPAELNASFESILDYNGPVYFRTGRSPLPPVYGSEEVRFELGRSQTLRQGTDATILAVGVMVHRALSAAVKLAEEGISARVVNMSSIKPLDVGIIQESAHKTGCIVTAEDHNIMGGLGGAVAEVLADTCPVPLNRVGLKDRFAESGDPEELSVKYGLMPEDICIAVKHVIKRK
jgi:transketolase